MSHPPTYYYPEIAFLPRKLSLPDPNLPNTPNRASTVTGAWFLGVVWAGFAVSAVLALYVIFLVHRRLSTNNATTPQVQLPLTSQPPPSQPPLPSPPSSTLSSSPASPTPPPTPPSRQSLSSPASPPSPPGIPQSGVYSTEMTLAYEQEKCVLCQFEFVDGEAISILPACQHVFHSSCIDEHMSSSYVCPCCRQRI